MVVSEAWVSKVIVSRVQSLKQSSSPLALTTTIASDEPRPELMNVNIKKKGAFLKAPFCIHGDRG
jgi:hypothetical protein